MAKQPTFTLPTTGNQADARLEVLCQIMAANKPLMEQLQAMMDAKDAYRAAEAEANAINTAMPHIRKTDFAADVNDIRVLSIVRTEAADESPIASLTIEYEFRGQPEKKSLMSCDRAVLKAAALSGKLPPRVRALADTPEEALERWYQGRLRGYLRG